MVLMPLYYGDTPQAINDGEGSDEQALEYARRYPDRFLPFVGMQRPELVDYRIWHWPTPYARWLVGDTDAKLRTGEFFGMGEFMLRFYPYRNKFGIVAPSDMDFPGDSYLMRTFADLSARYKVPMVVHAEAEPPVTDAIVRLLDAHPEAILVWAHNCGRSSARSIAALLAHFPNLHADLGGMVYSGKGVEHYGVYFPRRTPWMHLVVDETGGLLPEMKDVFEAHPDRFLIGTDIAHARVYQRYVDHLPRWRFMFQQLSADTARKIAYGNADRLLGRATGGAKPA
jgi:predicted TIM-barrel fold metal-dependent hydrolase